MRNLNSDRSQGIAEFVLIIALLALLAIGALALFGPICSRPASERRQGSCSAMLRRAIEIAPRRPLPQPLP